MGVIDEVKDGENHNFQVSQQVLGGSVSLVQMAFDMYGLLSQFPSGTLGMDAVVKVKMCHRCQYCLVMACLAVMRRHCNDSFQITRNAIESCGFAYRIFKHPHLADVWINAGNSDQDYEKYQKKFTKLFPRDHPELNKLGSRYDRCSKQQHTTIFSDAISGDIEKLCRATVFRRDYFDMLDDHAEPARTFLWTIQTHVIILKVFAEIFARDIAKDKVRWDLNLNALEAVLSHHAEKWRPAIKPAKKTRSARRAGPGQG